MGAVCNKPMESEHESHSKPLREQQRQKSRDDILEDFVLERSPSNRQRTKRKNSLFRVGSLKIVGSGRQLLSSLSLGQNSSTWGIKNTSGNNTPNRRASNYAHVYDAVMHNLNEAGALESGLPAGIVGLRNLGNTCFINSSLQCLSNTIPLTDYFLGYDYRKEINKDNFLGTGGKLVTAYAELMKDMWLRQANSHERIVHPSTFKRSLSTFAPQFGGNRQHDAQELLSYLLDGIHEDLNRVKKRPYIEDKDCDGSNDEIDAQNAWANYLRRNKSLVVDIFQGQFRNTCMCKKCGHKNIRFEPSMYLSLPINDSCRSLEDCLNLYLQEDNLTGDNRWYCEKCKTRTNATKKTDLWVLPPILIIHLKRFRYDDSGRAGRKNEAKLRYPIKEWDLSKSIRSQGGGTCVYDLYAVANHLGGLGSGHYTAYALNRFDDQWYEFNDSRYGTIDPHTTFETSSSPYLLFYNRVSPHVDEAMTSSNRGLLIRRQSISRPDLWPHAQVREGHFRDFTRASNIALGSCVARDCLDSLEEGISSSQIAPSHRASQSSNSDDVEVGEGQGERQRAKKKSKKSSNKTKKSRDGKRHSKSPTRQFELTVAKKTTMDVI